MSGNEDFVDEMFALPGDPAADPAGLLERFARAVEGLLSRSAGSTRAASESIGPLVQALGGKDAAAHRDPFLCDPVVVESLHRVSTHIPELDRWHRQVAVPSVTQLEPQHEATRPEELGNLLLPLAWRADPDWSGTLSMRSDLFGRVRIPLSDWSLLLSRTGEPSETVLSRHPVRFSLSREQGEWRGDAGGGTPDLVMSRDDCRRAYLDNADRLSVLYSREGRSGTRLSMHRAVSLGQGTLSYELVHSAGEGDVALRTGELISHILTALEAHSPVVFREFSRLMKVIRSFAAAGGPRGTIQSFSDPTQPRVMGINVAYSESGRPSLPPFSFVWFGHELGHTKMYLIDTIAYAAGLRFVTNADSWTGPVPRYGRRLSVRTVFQVPYVHCYEWALLMDLVEGAFRGLPIPVTESPQSAGDDLEREIAEALPLIEENAQLTSAGEAAVRRFRELFETLRARWKSLRGSA